MTRFNTNNPVPSASGKDLNDNAEFIDDVANSSDSTAIDRFGRTRDTLQGRLDKLGVIYDDPIRDWVPGLVMSDLRATRYPAVTGEVYIPTAPLPFTTGATFDPSQWVLAGGLTSDDLINDRSQTYNFESYQDMITNNDSIQFEVGKKLSTGQGVFKVTTKQTTVIIANTSPQLYAINLNGIWMRDCGAKGNANYRDDSTGLNYVDAGLTVLADDDTASFVLAMEATGGTDAKGAIHFGEGNFQISPEAVDVDGIDIRQKSLLGISPYVTKIVQSGNNTYQTLFRNNPRNLSEAGGWGSGGYFIIKNMYVRGNWDGASDQTFIAPESGNGNGLTGILKAEYDMDAQGAMIQLISSTRFELFNVWLSHGYGHNSIFFRGGYGDLSGGVCRSFATRGSGMYIDGPDASDAFTSTPIRGWKFETCRGQYGGIYVNQIWGSSITECLFEGQPYGIYMAEGGDVQVTGSYLESHYFEDIYIDSKCWGIFDGANYSFNQRDIREKDYKGLFHYRRDSGLHVDTDNVAFGTRKCSINNLYIQRDTLGHGIQLPSIPSTGGVYNQVVKPLAGGGGSSVEWYTSIKHSHNDSDDSGAAEIRFKRNLNQNSRSAIALCTFDGANLEERLLLSHDGDVELTGSGMGIILSSGNGTRYKITVGNTGTLTTTAV